MRHPRGRRLERFERHREAFERLRDEFSHWPPRTPEDEARLQVRALRRFYHHAVTYAVVNAALFALNLLTSPGHLWFVFPLLGWGIGLTSHAFRIFGSMMWLGRDWEEKKIAQILAKDKIKTLSSEKQLANAQLRMLQAQIEPHFLFNTLANVVSLVDVAPHKAKQMLEHFIGYLRSSLAISRQEQSSFSREEAMLRNYLSLLQIRMADRLSYHIEVEPALASHPIAPMLLQPLVENAIKHGLEPKIDGGHISVRVWREENRVKAEVQDNGLGFAAKTSMAEGSGIGLANLQERLNVLYDGKAVLTIEDAQPGTRVLIDVPYHEESA